MKKLIKAQVWVVLICLVIFLLKYESGKDLVAALTVISTGIVAALIIVPSYWENPHWYNRRTIKRLVTSVICGVIMAAMWYLVYCFESTDVTRIFFVGVGILCLVVSAVVQNLEEIGIGAFFATLIQSVVLAAGMTLIKNNYVLN